MAFFSNLKSYVTDLILRTNYTDNEGFGGVFGDLSDDVEEAYNDYELSIASAQLLGLLQKDPDEWFRGNTSDDEEAEINTLIAERDATKASAIAAKKAGDKAAMGQHFKRSDEIRDQLKAQGIVLEDGPDGTTWRRE
jgi:cysteinyl-tRNA synthetase